MEAVEGQSGEVWHQPSRKWLGLRLCEVGVTSAVLVCVAVAFDVTSHVPLAVKAIFLCAAVLFGVVLVIVELRRYQAWGYCERDRDFLVRRGVMVRRLTVVPYGRMQLVEASAGVAERAFGLATIKLHTAAAATDARIPGLEPDEATRLRDRLAALGEAQAAGV